MAGWGCPGATALLRAAAIASWSHPQSEHFRPSCHLLGHPRCKRPARQHLVPVLASMRPAALFAASCVLAVSGTLIGAAALLEALHGLGPAPRPPPRHPAAAAAAALSNVHLAGLCI